MVFNSAFKGLKKGEVLNKAHAVVVWTVCHKMNLV